MQETKEKERMNLTAHPEENKDKVVKAPKDVNLLNAIPRAWAMFDSLLHREYKAIPVFTLIGVAVAVAYIVLPADVVPDFIPFLGYVDDAGILALLLTLAQRDIVAYELWKQNAPAEQVIQEEQQVPAEPTEQEEAEEDKTADPQD